MPTRTRPQNALNAYRSAEETKSLHGTRIIWLLDESDKRLDEYRAIADENFIQYLVSKGNMVQRSNDGLSSLIGRRNPVGWAADDNEFKTRNWDSLILEALADSPIVSVNDLHYGDFRPQNYFFRKPVLDALGWICLPSLEHLYVEIVWQDLSAELGGAYLLDVHIEHMHPFFGKGTLDNQYGKYNTPAQDKKDREAYEFWKRNQFSKDVISVRDYLR